MLKRHSPVSKEFDFPFVLLLLLFLETTNKSTILPEIVKPWLLVRLFYLRHLMKRPLLGALPNP
jgi:hypothetical protein